MIITCQHCDKKFEVNENLIPNEGRLLQCGSCNRTWFFNKNSQPKSTPINDIPSKKNQPKRQKTKNFKKAKKFDDRNLSNFKSNTGSEIVKYQPNLNFTFFKFLSYILIFIISFIGLIIVLDTFKSPLYNIFPNLELVLFSLYETLKDIELFINDLF